MRPPSRALAAGIRHSIKLGLSYELTMKTLKIVPALIVALLRQSRVENNLRFDCMSALGGIRAVV